MKTYVVGGAVRDRLLGLPVSDRDHVVVGATVDEMLALGFKPIGRDFPVFLHPHTHEEYALARTERKVAPGYAGFVFHADPTVTLEADLERRDLTVNAMAEDEANGELIDPFGGQADLVARVFRHVGPAFVEDPVRILRLARFAARFDDFTIAPETLALMRRMVAAGEVDALVAERVWQEVARGLMERRPSRMLDALQRSGAFERLFPELKSATGEALDRAATGGAPLETRFAAWVQRCPVDGVAALCDRLAVPRAVRDVAIAAVRERDALLAAGSPDAKADELVAVMERTDAFRRAARFVHIVDAVTASIDSQETADRFRAQVTRALTAARSIDAGAVARAAGPAPDRIAAALRAERIRRVAQ